MPAETGGLQYLIRLDDQASGAIEGLIAKINELRQAAAGLGEGFGQIRQVGQQAREVAGGVEELATSTRKSTKASKDAASAYDIEAKAIERVKREHESALVAQRAEIEATRIGITTKRQAAAARKAETAAIHEQARAIQEQSEIRKQEIADIQAVAQADISAHSARLQAARDFAQVNKAAREEELALLKKDIEARNNLSRLDQPTTRSGLSRDRLQQESALARAEAAIDDEAQRRRQQNLREDIQARAAAATERIRIAAAEGRAEAALDETEQRKRFNNLKQDIIARAAAASERVQIAAQEGLAEAAADARNAAARTRRLRENIQERLQAQNSVRGLNTELGRTEAVGNRISFTFRRLFGILAAFTIIRQIFQGFRQLVIQSIAFNAQLEQSALSIAALVVATGDVRDASGEAVDSARAFTLAQQEARKQMKLLRIDALRTAATFDDLALAFQTAVAPGQQVGFSLDQIRKFAVQISQAATAIGLPQQQLAEEIRALLQGTIQPRTTRIATALGITNEDVRRARQLGTLSEFLDERFQSFAKAAEEGGTNLTVIVSRLKNVALLIGGAASAKLFEALKLDLKDILDSLVKVKSEGDEPIINPDAIAAVKGIFDGLNEALTVARDLRKELSLGDIADVARGIGSAFAAAAQIVAPIIKGVVQGIGDAVKILKPITGLLATFTKGFGGEILSSLARVLTFFFLISGVVGGIVKSFGVINGILRAAVLSTIRLGRAMRIVSVNTATFGRNLRNAARGLGIFAVIEGLARTLPAASEGAKELLETAGKLPESLQLGLLDTFQAQFTATLNQMGILSDKTAFDMIRNLRTVVLQAFNEDQARQVGTSLANSFDELLPTIGRIREGLEGQEETLRNLSDEFLEVEHIKRRTLQHIQAEGAAQNVLAIAVDAEIQSLREGQRLRDEALESEQRVRVLKEQQQGLAARTARIEDERVRKAIDDHEAELRAELATQKALTEASSERLRLERERVTAFDQLVRGEVPDESLEVLDAALEQVLQKERLLKAEQKARLERAKTALPAGLEAQTDTVSEIALERIRLEGQLKVEQEAQNEIKAEHVDLDREILRIALQRVEIVAAQETEELRKQNRELTLRIAQEDRIRQSRLSDLELVTDAPLREQLAINTNITEELVEQKKLTQEIFSANLAALNETRNDLIKTQTPEDLKTNELLQIDRLISAEKEKQALIEEDINAKLKEAIDLTQRLTDAGASFASAFGLGLQAAFAQFRATAPDALQTAFAVGQQALDGFVAIGREAFASIFDPNSNFSIKEALGRLLLQIADTLINSALRGLLATILSGEDAGSKLRTASQESATVLTAAGETLRFNMISGAQTAAAILTGASATQFASTAGNPISFFGTGQTGGRVPQPQYRASGGVLGIHPGRPKGRDTVPLWGEPDEWMIRARSSRMYGQQVMAAINDGLIDPTSLRALASVSGAVRSRTVRMEKGAAHMASGGSVPSGGSGGRGTTVVPAIVTDERTMAQILSGGEGAMTRWLADRNYLRG